VKNNVMRGLDPHIHLFWKKIDHRVKPGDDHNKTGSSPAQQAVLQRDHAPADANADVHDAMRIVGVRGYDIPALASVVYRGPSSPAADI
jgi:hypothetical protein